MRSALFAVTLSVFSLTFAACSSEPEAQLQAWQMVFENDYLAKDAKIPGALLSVWGSSENDVWMVGGPQEVTPTQPPTILNWNGTAWNRLVLPKIFGTLWWVTGGAPGVLWMAGKDGLVIRWNRTENKFTRETIPSTKQLWGILAFSDTNAWAVGGEAAECHDNLPCGVIWHFDGQYWSAPTDLPAGWNTTAWFKVFARSKDDLFICGMNGHILHWNGAKWADEIPVNLADASAPPSKLLTGSCNGKLCVAVGGDAVGVVVEHDGTQWTRKQIAGLDPMNGVYVNADGSAVAVGYTVWNRTAEGTWSADNQAPLATQQFHGVYVDPLGATWAVGGDLFGFKTSQLAHHGSIVIPKPVPAAQ